MAKDEKLKALDLALSQIEKDFGKEAIMRLGAKHAKEKVDAIPTGALPLDIAIGIGGIPRGRVIEIYGPESSGKSTLAMCMVAETQKLGGIAAYIDAEHAMDPEYAKKLGADIDNLLISQPDSGEQALEIADKLIRSGAVDIIVVDSVAALVPKAEIEGEMGDSFMGLQARLMSQALRKLTSNISKSNTAIVFINQLRQKIGVMWGNPETTPGGLALKFYSSVRLDIRRIESVKKGDEILGNRVRVKVVKNKVAAPFKQAEFEIIFGVGIDKMGYLIDIGVNDAIIDKAGAFFSYKGERLGQGRDNVKVYLTEHPEIAAEIEEKIRAKAFGGADVESANEAVKEESAAEAPKEKAVKGKKADK
ncbi:recombinase RecA [Endomicrobium proavitum]|uniref:Protein RecA n=1 Tax=Endomicrobium proavitum TaxID=1408281 RepID=A0A0G3WGF4_9BACT|nr:recombinase RecA [Endomicrobium proavitum]AKL97756.1 DNA strand exchange and recombination protein with protease and nuclease activity [Endomicrobium proavitum]